jgi:outer membrane lipoprotein-sorting protein
MIINKNNLLSIIILIGLYSGMAYTQEKVSAEEIVKISDQKARGKTLIAKINIKIVRPKWTRNMTLKSWSIGNKLMTSLVTSPAKEKGIVYLMNNKDIWNYIPSINRTIKLPPSMMLQSWMGTDLTNDDLIKQSSIVEDYNQKILKEEVINDLNTWKIELIPLEDATVVWGKILLWIDKKDFMQVKIEFYDEDDFLINTMNAVAYKIFDGRKLPSIFEYIPNEKKGNKTIIEYESLQFDSPIDEKIFSTNYMKRLR